MYLRYCCQRFPPYYLAPMKSSTPAAPIAPHTTENTETLHYQYFISFHSDVLYMFNMLTRSSNKL